MVGCVRPEAFVSSVTDLPEVALPKEHTSLYLLFTPTTLKQSGQSSSSDICPFGTHDGRL